MSAVAFGLSGPQFFAMDRWDDEGAWENPWYDNQAREWIGVNATAREKCGRCGKAHPTIKCNTNLDKVKCYSCGDMGHIGAKCPQTAKESKGKEGKGKDNKGKGGNPRGAGEKGKGNKGGKHRKKGKMNELAYNCEDWEGGQEWLQEWGGY